MSYASLLGLPDAGDTPWWYRVRAELDMRDEPMSEMHWRLQELGDQPTFEDIIDGPDGREAAFVIEYHGGLWRSEDAYGSMYGWQPFPCAPGSCSSCDRGRAVAAIWGEAAAVEHVF